MNKLKFYKIIAVILLISNLSLITFLIYNKRPEHVEPKNQIVKQLGFDENQIKDYEVLIKQHQANIRAAEEKIKTQKEALYTTLINNDAITKDSLITILGKEQIKIENIHYNHFQDIKKLCRQNQLQAYNTLTQDLAKLFGRKVPKPRR